MYKTTLVFQVDHIRKEKEMLYPDIPSKKKLEEDFKEWMLSEFYMWFAVIEGGEEVNLEDI